MSKPLATVKRKNPAAVKELLGRYRNSSVLAIGWPKGTNSVGLRYPDGTPVLMVAAANNFGADINHPGGTKYTIGPDGKARFVPNSHAGPVAGVTKPHKISIPARPFMRLSMAPAREAIEPVYKVMLPLINAGKATPENALQEAGPYAEAAFKKTMRDLREPPNAPSTVAKKKSDNPLVDTGLLIQSLTHVVRGKES